MYIRILKKHARFLPGQEFTATRQLALSLIAAGVAKTVTETKHIPPSKMQEVEPDDISNGIKEAIKTTPVKKTKPKTVKKKTPPKVNPTPKNRK